MIVGDGTKFPFPEATMMVGRCTNLDGASPWSLQNQKSHSWN